MLTDTASLRVSSCWVCGNWQEHRFVFNGGATATATAAATAAAATAAAAGSGGSAGSGSSGGSWRPGVPYQTQQTHQARQNQSSFFEDDEVEVNHKGKGEWYRATIALVRPDGTW